jgi:hypothetical protein
VALVEKRERNRNPYGGTIDGAWPNFGALQTCTHYRLRVPKPLGRSLLQPVLLQPTLLGAVTTAGGRQAAAQRTLHTTGASVQEV